MKPFLYAALILYALSFFIGPLSRMTGWKRSGLSSKWLLVAGLLLHTAALGIRMHSTGHAPMASMYETILFYSWTTVLTTAVVIFRYGERAVEAITVPVAVVALLFAFAKEAPGGPLNIFLRTRWFEVHVIFSFAAYALFTLAFAGALLYLLTGKDEDHPDMRRYQDIAARGVLWGFFLFSAAMFSGAVWAYLAWGMYWLWEPKSIWSFIVWFYYAGAMHAYYVRGWRGKGLSIATVAGMFVVLFTYLGVSLLMKSSHSF